LNGQLAFLNGLFKPTEMIKKYENAGQNFERLTYLELMKTKPLGTVYDYYCSKNNIPIGEEYITEIQKYEADVTSKR
jgi:L-rhamnose isomerase